VLLRRAPELWPPFDEIITSLAPRVPADLTCSSERRPRLLRGAALDRLDAAIRVSPPNRITGAS
jgi:hypothetical protein